MKILSKRNTYIAKILFMLASSAMAYNISRNSDEPGVVSIVPYSDYFLSKRPKIKTGDELPRAYLVGFTPFKKYVGAKEYLTDKKYKNYHKRPELLNVQVYNRTVLSVFYTKEYFQALYAGWFHGEELPIYNAYFKNFLTMVNMANIPYYSKEKGHYLTELDIHTILALYDIFELNHYERIPVDAKKYTNLDMTKRDCFKENMRFLIERSKDGYDAYLGILRHIKDAGRAVFMSEVPATPIDTKDWANWVLSRKFNLDLFWYLYSTLCNNNMDVRKKRIVTYVKETSVLGKKGLKIYLSNKKKSEEEYIGLSHYLLYNNPLKVKNMEIAVQEGLGVPERQLKSVVEAFRNLEVVYFSSLGNFDRIENNLSLVNVVLDVEKKRRERNMTPVLRGFAIYDYNSLNKFAKRQLLKLDLVKVGFMTKQERCRTCIEMGHRCLYKLNHRQPNFLGMFAIKEDNIRNVRGLISPYKIVFDEQNVEQLYNLSELGISIDDKELPDPYQKSELPYGLRTSMYIKTVRLFGDSRKQAPSHLDMFKKILKITSADHIDISSLPFLNSEILSVLQSDDNYIRDNIKIFAFTYFDPGQQVAHYNKAAGGPNGHTGANLLQQLLITLPSIERLDITIINDREEAAAFVEDFKYLFRCGGTKYTEEQLKKIINIKIHSPLEFTSVQSCRVILETAISRIQKSIHKLFEKIKTCPIGKSDSIKKMTLQEFMLTLKHVMSPNICLPEPGPNTG
ncbi:hypothetical protein NEMIN01_1538 [Nematocida minor]|uniref:uncharacterized protein n=1 Tax=Nematocida minor TaxID=1912983 RepID=UPI00221EA2FB|nr:uncharacterized protein NEMIN01_1538 [Nematocida minor]KAI5191512.1 hypothetical protein NEMIN01_1538 [Nematocida minor]